MISEKIIYNIAENSIKDLINQNICKNIDLKNDSILLGENSFLDSIGFVSFLGVGAYFL